MIFLSWDKEQDAIDSLEAVHTAYGCPYEDEKTGYRADHWDILVPSSDGGRWGFYKPQSRLGKEMSALIKDLIPGYSEHLEKPQEFYPEQLEEV